MNIAFSSKGKWDASRKLLEITSKQGINLNILKKYAELGVMSLANNTPMDTGTTADSWYYTITNQNGRYKISFYNSNIVEGVPIAIILQYGHATRNGGWVEGRDYINPALAPIFDEMADRAWKEAIG